MKQHKRVNLHFCKRSSLLSLTPLISRLLSSIFLLLFSSLLFLFLLALFPISISFSSRISTSPEPSLISSFSSITLDSPSVKIKVFIGTSLVDSLFASSSPFSIFSSFFASLLCKLELSG